MASEIEACDVARFRSIGRRRRPFFLLVARSAPGWWRIMALKSTQGQRQKSKTSSFCSRPICPGPGGQVDDESAAVSCSLSSMLIWSCISLRVSAYLYFPMSLGWWLLRGKREKKRQPKGNDDDDDYDDEEEEDAGEGRCSLCLSSSPFLRLPFLAFFLSRHSCRHSSRFFFSCRLSLFIFHFPSRIFIVLCFALFTRSVLLPFKGVAKASLSDGNSPFRACYQPAL